MSHTISPIAFIRTPYKEKFAIPRQPGLVSEATGTIEFVDEYNDPNMIRGLEQFSHIWLIFQFHQTNSQGWSPLVRPPRLGGNEKLGVLASRSTFRPNNLGMSVVSMTGTAYESGQLKVFVNGMDLLDGTPIIDIKPYIPYADALPDATGGFASTAPSQEMKTEFSPSALNSILSANTGSADFKTLIMQVLNQDPRPAYKRETDSERVYGVRLFDYNVRWKVTDNINYVIEVASVDTTD